LIEEQRSRDFGAISWEQNILSSSTLSRLGAKEEHQIDHSKCGPHGISKHKSNYLLLVAYCKPSPLKNGFFSPGNPNMATKTKEPVNKASAALKMELFFAKIAAERMTQTNIQIQ